MDDYLSEQEQWEWVKAQVRENAPAVLLAVVLGAGVIYGWRWWQGHQDARQLEAGAKYMQMVRSLEGGDRSQALVQLGELERDYASSPYSDQARLLAAVTSVVDEYRGEIVRQAETINQTTSLPAPTDVTPQVQLQFSPSGAEAKVRYPVPRNRTAQVDERVSQKLHQLLRHAEATKPA